MLLFITDYKDKLLLAATIYKLAILIFGFITIYLGYLLFLKGVYKSGGDMTAKWKTNEIVLKKGAPGTFFSLFGAFIICVATFKDFGNYEKDYTMENVNNNGSNNVANKDSLINVDTNTPHFIDTTQFDK